MQTLPIAIWRTSILGFEAMTEADQKREDDVLRRMLNTPPRPHKPIGLTPPKAKKTKPTSK
jgi:hypothetical protein